MHGRENCDSEKVVTGAKAVIDPIDQLDVRLLQSEDNLLHKCSYTLLSVKFFPANLKLFWGVRHIS